VSAQANYTSDSKSYQLCPQGSTCVVVAPGPSTPGAGTLQSQANDGDASAEAHVDLQTGSMGVQASGYSRADAEFSNAFYCTSSSPCEVVPTGGIQALMHFSLDGTILPPSVAGNGSYGGYLEAGFDFTENDIGGGSLSFRFETDYDDTLDQPPTFQVTFNGQQYTPTYKYETQPDGSVKVSMSWDQPFTLCTYGCNGSSASSYAISGGGSEGSLFGTTEKAYITSDGVGAADFSHTFTTSITSLDPRYTFFSDSGLLAPTTTRTPEPGSMVLLISGLFGVPWLSRRKKRS
ncbi:MAG: hypothetical protein ACRD3E_00210, partial [Terriglobales bacterium]